MGHPRMATAAALTMLVSCASEHFAPSMPDVLTYEDGPAHYTYADFQFDVKSYRDTDGKTDDQSLQLRRRFRDRIARRMMSTVAAAYGTYEQDFFAGRAVSASGFDFIDLALDAAVTIVNGERTKTVLGAIATAVHGVGLSVDKNFFREKTSEAILATMRAQRTNKENAIEKKLKTDSDTYPLEEVWKDVLDLYYAGTVHSALISIAESAGAAAKAAEDEQKRLLDDRVVRAESRRP